MSNLSPDLTRRIREQLLNCHYFDSDHELKAIFVQSLIAPWQKSLPQANSLDSRVNQVINLLEKQRRYDTGESALALLLQVLSDMYDPMTMDHHQLAKLAQEVAHTLGQSTPPPTTPTSNVSALRQQLTLMSDTDLDFFCLEHFPAVMAKFTDNMAKDRKIFLLMQQGQADNYQRLQIALGS